jgi:hypothetical protein
MIEKINTVPNLEWLNLDQSRFLRSVMKKMFLTAAPKNMFFNKGKCLVKSSMEKSRKLLRMDLLVEHDQLMEMGRVLNSTRVARWFVFIPKMPIWVYFLMPRVKSFWLFYIWPFGISKAILVYFIAIWYFYCHFGLLVPFLMFQEKSGNTVPDSPGSAVSSD